MTAIEFLKKKRKFTLAMKEFDRLRRHSYEFEELLKDDTSLMIMFCWQDSKQGYNYWSELNTELYLINLNKS